MNNMDLLNTFIQESLELLDNAESNLLELEKKCLNHTSEELEENQKEHINQLFRSIHTIKGNSGLFELNKIKKLSHDFENLLSMLRDGSITITHSFIDTCLLAIDKLKEMINNIENSEEYNIDDVLNNFYSIIKQNQKEEKSFNVEKQEFNLENSNNEFSEKIYDKFINKYNKKIDKIIETLKENQNLYFILSFINKNELLSDFVKKIENIKKNNQIQLLDYHFIYPLNKEQLLFYLLFISNENNVNLQIPILLQKELKNINKSFNISNKDFISNEQPKGISQELGLTEESNIINTNKIVHKNQEEESFLKVPASLVENLINLAGESIIARNELIQKIEIFSKDNRDLINSTKKVSTYISLLQENLMKLRLQKLDVLFERIPRLVRELSRETKKEVELEIYGGNIELDKTLIDAIRDPLTHIIRNAIDHGIELPEERKQKGKSIKGKLEVKAFLQGSNVIIKISDDGNGIDTNKILQKAIEKNLITKLKAKELTKKEIIDLIFLPGFSTAEKVTERSGRGVGMDVVKKSLKTIKGFVEITSELNQGTTITLTIPQTLSIITCLIIKILNQKFAIQQNMIFEIIRLNPKQLYELHGGLVYELRGKIVPIIDPEHFIQLQEQKEEYEYIIFLETDQHIFGILVNDILNPEELMIKPLGEDFQEIPYFMGGSILGDGSTILILDVSGIARYFQIESNKKDILEEKESLKVKKQLKEQYLIFELNGNYYGVSIHLKPRILEVSTSQIESLLDYNAFKYNQSIVPILDMNALLNLKSNKEIFNQKNFYAILFDLAKIKNESNFISLLASDIINITNKFEGLQKEETNSFIDGYGIYMDKTIILLNLEKIIEKWKNVHYIKIN